MVFGVSDKPSVLFLELAQCVARLSHTWARTHRVTPRQGGAASDLFLSAHDFSLFIPRSDLT